MSIRIRFRAARPAFLAVVSTVLAFGGILSNAQECPPGNLGDAVVSTPATRLNVYFAAPDPTSGTTSIAAGSTAILVDPIARGLNIDPRVPTTVSAGDVLVVIQMQGADIDTSDNHAATGDYGDGTGPLDQRGYVNNSDFVAGRYEYVTATGPLSGGSIPIVGQGGGGGLVYNYVNSDTVDSTNGTAQQGIRRYQVIKVGQFQNLEVTGSLAPDRWNGRWGGVLAVDVADTLFFNGGSIDGSGRGFRGGQFFPGRSDNSESQTNGNFGFKGEGLAGRPSAMFSAVLLAESGTSGEEVQAVGYPGVDDAGPAGTEWTRDTGQGSPGNGGSGGGGGEDAGGGGGSNGGAGGDGGEGVIGAGSEGQGAAQFSVVGPLRLVPGGGGGSSNGNDTGSLDLTVSSGQSGGAMLLIRAQVIDGSGGGFVISNGDSGGTAPTEGGGGGGAGGSVLLLSNSSSLTGVSLSANGGQGGSSTQNNDGGGGGGGGGVIYVLNTTSSTLSVTGGPLGTGNSGGTFNGDPGSTGITGVISTSGAGLEPVFCEFPAPVIGVAKQMSLSGSGPWSVTIDLYLENFGGPVRNLSLLEDLEAVFGAEGTDWTLTSITTPAGPTFLGHNAAFDGEAGSVTEVIDPANNRLGAAGSGNETAQIQIVLQLITPGSFQNQVTLTGSDSSGRSTDDFSDDGTDPDPDGGGDPNEVTENDPSTLAIATPTVGIAKRVVSTSTLGGSVYDIGFELRVENLSGAQVDNIQVTDDLIATFPTATAISIIGTPNIGSFTPPATAYTGTSDIDLLSGSDSMAIGASETITFTVRVDVGTPAAGSYRNQAIVTSSATPGGVVLYTDLSDDGTDVDPDNDGDPNESIGGGDDSDENDPTRIVLDQGPFTCDASQYSVVGIQSPAESQLYRLDRSVFPYGFTPRGPQTTIVGGYPNGFQVNCLAFNPVNNYMYAMVQRPDNDALGYDRNDVVRIDASGNMVVLESDLPGLPLLTGGTFLADGTYVVSVTNGVALDIFTIGVTPTSATLLTSNTIAGVTTNDIAVNPTDLDLDRVYFIDQTGPQDTVRYADARTGTLEGSLPNPTGTDLNQGTQFFDSWGTLFSRSNTDSNLYQVDMDPTSGTYGVATLIQATPTGTEHDGASCAFDVAMRKTATPSPVNAGGRVTYTYLISNPRSLPVSGLTFTDTMDVGRTYVAGTLTSSLGGAPNAYGGTGALTITGIAVPPNTVATITVEVDIPLATAGTTVLNQATLAGLDPSLGGSVVSDFPDTLIYGDPTPVDVLGATAVIGISKQLTTTRQVGPTTYEFDFSLLVENFNAVDPAPNVQVTDDLNAAFPGVTSITVVGTPSIGGFTAPATAYDGVGNNNLLAGSDSLAASGTETLAFTVRVGFGAATGPFENQASVTASDAPGGNVLYTDLSDDGTDPDPNDGAGGAPDGNPNSNPGACTADPNDVNCEDTPTAIVVNAQVIGVAKQLTAVRLTGVNQYELDFSLLVENLGTVAATNVQVIEDLNVTFPGVVSVALVGTPSIGSFNAPATAFDGVGNNNLIAGSDGLAIGATETITFTVAVETPAGSNSYENQVQATVSDTPGGTILFSDFSDDGVDPDPNDGAGGAADGNPNSNAAACLADPNDTNCEDTPTAIVLPPQVIGIAKQLTATRQAAPGVFEADFSLVVENLSATQVATNVQVTDDLIATFPAATAIAVIGTPNIGGFTAPSTAYTGTSNLNLLAGTDSLAAGATETITFTVRVNVGAALGPFENQATVTASDTPGGIVVFSDVSDDGTDPDPNDGAGGAPDGNPNSNAAACTVDATDPNCEDTPTVVLFSNQVVGIAKAVTGVRTTGIDRYEIDFSLNVENLGAVAATNVQVTEDLNTAFPGVVSVAVVGTPNIGGFTPPSATFNGVGNNNLIFGSDTLAVGQARTILFTVAVQTPPGTNAYENQVEVTASDLPGGFVLASDLSDSGTESDPNDGAGGPPDGNPNSNPAACLADPNDPNCEDTPTGIVLPPQIVGVAKQLTAARQVRGTIYEFDFSLVVENLSPTQLSTNVQVSDDLSAAFPGAASVSIVGTPSIGGFSAPATAYDGTANIDLLAGSDSLAVGATETITFTARVDLGTAAGPFANSATVTVSDAPGGTVIYSDLSDDGTDPDPNDGTGGPADGSPNSNPAACIADPNDPNCEDTPTAIVIDAQVIGIAKQLVATRPISAGVFEADFSLVVENLSATQIATNVQVTENLSAAFPGVTSIAIVGTPSIGGFTAPATAFDGTANTLLLAGSDNLAAATTVTITFTARIDLGAATGPFENTATVTASETPGGTVLFSDDSDDGTDPDPNDGAGGPADGNPNSNPGACIADPNDPNCEDTPTTIDFLAPVVGIAKQLAVVRSVGVNQYELDFSLVVENLGTIPATNVQVIEDLNAAFPGVVSIAVVGTPSIGGFTAPTTAFDGVGNNNLIAGADTLAIGATETITFTVAVQTPPGSNAYENQAQVTVSDSPGGAVLFGDLSDSGTDPDPNDGAGGPADGNPNSNPAACLADPTDPNCEDTPTAFVLPPQVVGIAKQLTAGRQVRGTIYEFDFSLLVENLSTTQTATNVQVVDDLSAAFPGVASISIVGTPTIGGFAAPATAYDGTANTELLAGSDNLVIGATGTITFTARVDLGTATGPFVNSATVTVADAPGGIVLFADLSDDGTDPDPNDGAGGPADGNPNSNPAACTVDPNDPNCEDTPTTISVTPQTIGIAKQVTATRQTAAGQFEIDFSLVVENLSATETATNVQVADDLSAAFPGVTSIVLLGTPNLGGLTAPAAAFDGVGTNNLLAGNDNLAPGATATITFSVQVIVGTATGPFANTATVTVADSPGGTVLFSDDSDDGVDPDPNDGAGGPPDGDPNSNPGACIADPNDANCENTPTIVLLDEQVIGVAKQLTAVRQIGGNVFEADFSLVVENLSGTVAATNVQVTDDLAAAFPGVASITVIGAPSISGFTPPATTYNGVGNNNLLSGADTMAAGNSETVTLTVRVDTGGATGPFENQARAATFETPGGTELSSDLSDDGTDPDPNDGAGGPSDGNPNSNPAACIADPADIHCENTPTAISFSGQVVGIAKQLSALREIALGVFEVDFSLVVENLGAIPATNVQVTDDLAAAFPGVASISIVGSPSIGGFTAPGTTYNGIGNNDLLAGADTLAVGASETIAFTARIDRGTAAGPFANSATVTASDAPGGNVLFTDLSDDGTDPDPNDGAGGPSDGNPNSNPGACVVDPTDINCENTPTNVVLQSQSIGIAKQATAIRYISGSQYEVDFRLIVENLAGVPATNVRVRDDLAAAFPGVASIAISGTPALGGFTPPATAYDGTGSNDLISGADTLAVGVSRTITFTTVIDVAGAPTRLFSNSASTTSAATPGGPAVAQDLSDDGADPDPNGDGNGNSDPAACALDPTDPDCEDTPTPVLLETTRLGLAKAASIVDLTITLDFYLENESDVALANLTLVDDLDATFGAGNYSITAAPSIVADPGAGLNLNPLFDGSVDQALLLAGSVLSNVAPNNVAQIQLVVTVASPGAYFNQATAEATTPTGSTITELSTNGTDPDVDSTEADGTTPDGGVGINDNNGDPSDNNEPTPIILLVGDEILFTKTADRPVTSAGDFVGYTLNVENVSAAALPNVTVVDSIPAGLSYVVDSGRLVRAGADTVFGTADDVSVAVTATGTRPVTFGPFDLGVLETVQVRYIARVGATAVEGMYRNTAVPQISGIPVGNPSSVEVRVESDPIFQQTTVIGKVFGDANGDGIQGPGEFGIPGVRLATVGGLLIETDRFGRYHIADVDGGRFDRGGNFILKLDTSTLPEGSRITTENPRVVRMTQGIMSSINFGVALPAADDIGGGSKTVQVDETVYFDDDSSQLRPEDRERLKKLGLELADASDVTIRITGFTMRKAGAEPEEETVYEQRKASFRLTPHFPILSAELQPNDLRQLDEIADRWKDAIEVVIDVVGHTSSVGISARSRHIFPDNYALSEARARSVGDYLAQRLSVPDDRVNASGKGPDEPVATNATAEGRSANRRTELELSGAFPIQKVITKTPEELAGEGYNEAYDLELGKRRADAVAAAVAGEAGVGVRLETDSEGHGQAEIGGGQPDRRAELRGSYDVALPAGGYVQVTEDPALPESVLNLGAPNTARIVEGRIVESVPFVIYNNYPAFIDRWEILIRDASDEASNRSLARLTGQQIGSFDRVVWNGETSKPLKEGQRLSYVLRVFDENGAMDESRRGLIRVAARDDSTADSEPYDGLEIYGTNGIAKRSIPIRGSRVRFSGTLATPTQQLSIGGSPVPADPTGRFAAERLLPFGRHNLNFKLEAPSTRPWEQDYPFEVTGKYFFLVGIADLTVGQNDEVTVEPLASDDRYDGEVFTDGRVAFYLKGKVKGKYLITAQLDTTEDNLDDILSGMDEEDPRRVFRNLDPDRYYPVYGDDSTSISDVDTQGRFYVRMDWDRSTALWGNYNTSFTGTEFAQFNRSLYGAMVDYQSPSTTEFGENERNLDVFASQAQTVFAHDEFRATGGSLYYLRETDMVQGSEKISVEIRDRDSERIVDSTPMVRGRDYEIDEIQGRILLNRPLTQIAVQARPSLILDDPLDGNDVYLVADYEYLPQGFAAGDWTYGARGKLWATDQLALGGTFVEENRDNQDYSLMGGDLTWKMGQGSYVKAEWADTEATQAGQSLVSTDGGLSFTQMSNATVGPRDGQAVGVEARVDFADFGDTDGAISAWWRQRDAGFSTARLDTGVETTEAGFEGQWQATDKLRVSGRAASVEREQVRTDESYSLQADFDGGKWDLAGEVRHVVEETPTTAEDADLAAVKLGYDVAKSTNVYAVAQATVSNSVGYAVNDRYTLGVRSRLGAKLGVRAEASSGDRGDGALAGVDYQASPNVKLTMATTTGGLGEAVQAGADWRVNDQQTVYGTFTQSTDRTDAERGVATIGQRGRISDQLEVFTEGQFTHSDRQAGLTQVYGLDYKPTADWSMGVSLQRSELDTANVGDIDRDAISVWGGYRKGRGAWSSKLELRDDRGVVDQTQWLTSNRADFRVNPSWTLLAKLNASESEPDATTIASARFIEGAVGFAYRPVENSRWNVLGKYTYLYDLPSIGQGTLRTDQKSNVLSVEATREIGKRWSLGGKLAAKTSEIRLDRDAGDWIDNDLNLAILQLRFHIVSDWDGLAEYRRIWSGDADDERSGVLLGAYKHLGDHVKLGVGFNFTNFTDDLTQIDEDASGWFVNAVGKF